MKDCDWIWLWLGVSDECGSEGLGCGSVSGMSRTQRGLGLWLSISDEWDPEGLGCVSASVMSGTQRDLAVAQCQLLV